MKNVELSGQICHQRDESRNQSIVIQKTLQNNLKKRRLKISIIV